MSKELVMTRTSQSNVPYSGLGVRMEKHLGRIVDASGAKSGPH